MGPGWALATGALPLTRTTGGSGGPGPGPAPPVAVRDGRAGAARAVHSGLSAEPARNGPGRVSTARAAAQSDPRSAGWMRSCGHAKRLAAGRRAACLRADPRRAGPRVANRGHDAARVRTHGSGPAARYGGPGARPAGGLRVSTRSRQPRIDFNRFQSPVPPGRGSAAGPGQCRRAGSVQPGRVTGSAAGPVRCGRDGSVVDSVQRGRVSAARPCQCRRAGPVRPGRVTGSAAGPTAGCTAWAG